MKKSRTFQANVEGLEERLALSTMAAHTPFVALRGSGTLTAANVNNLANQVQVGIALNGTITPLGTTHGTLQTTVATKSLHFSAIGTMTGANGDQLNIQFSGQNQKVRVHQTHATGRYHFRVTGGTGAYAHTMGSGTITVTQDMLSTQPVETFSINGKIRG